jgi:hypothetical protein
MFWWVKNQPQGEFRITCSKLSAFYKVVTLVKLQNIKLQIYNMVYFILHNTTIVTTL